jgi:hypothetical protein
LGRRIRNARLSGYQERSVALARSESSKRSRALVIPYTKMSAFLSASVAQPSPTSPPYSMASSRCGYMSTAHRANSAPQRRHITARRRVGRPFPSRPVECICLRSGLATHCPALPTALRSSPKALVTFLHRWAERLVIDQSCRLSVHRTVF